MRILLTGGTDVYGHSLVFLFLRDAPVSESAPSSACDRASFHAQLRPCLNILMSNPHCPGVSVVADFRDVTSVDHLNAIISSLVICQNELGSNITICYFVEPSSRQLRRALCRFVKCGTDESNKNSSAFRIPFQVLLFSGTKCLKDHMKSNMLPEELGGTLLFDEVSYLLQIAVFDTLSKLKTSIAAMHSFTEGAASGDVLDGDVSSCLEQFSQLREQAFGLYSHLKNAAFNRFDPFPLFRKLFAEGDALHSLATQIRAVLMERQHRLNAFSTLCSKLGEGERLLRALEVILKSPGCHQFCQGAKDASSLQVDQFFAPDASDCASQFFGDFHYLLETAVMLNEDPLGGQLKAGFDLDAISQQLERIESLYSTAAKHITLSPPQHNEEVTATGECAKRTVELELEHCTGPSPNSNSGPSPCPPSSSSMSHAHSDSTAPSSHNKAATRTPSSFSEVSPVAADELPAAEVEFGGASRKPGVSVSIQTDSVDIPVQATSDAALVEKSEKKRPSLLSRTSVLEIIRSQKKIANEIAMSSSNRLAPSVAELAQLVNRFETRAAELRQQSHSTTKTNVNNSHQSLAEMKTLLVHLTTAVTKVQEQSKQQVLQLSKFRQ